MMLVQQAVGMQVHTVGVGVAIGQACMLLAAGHKGKRFMLPHATGARQQLSLPAGVLSYRSVQCFVQCIMISISAVS